MREQEISWGAVIVAGGSGRRMGSDVNKVLLPLGGKPVICRTLEAILPHCACAVLVVKPEERPVFASLVSSRGWDQVLFADAGQERQDSVFHGLLALKGRCSHVMIHDGARCLVTADVIERVKADTLLHGAAAAALPVTDTIRRADQRETACGVLKREELRAMQTPQAFALEAILSAHGKARAGGVVETDDVALLERLGIPVHLTMGSKRNFKLTTPEDLERAAMMLKEGEGMLRIGQGYDVHALVTGRKLILCGIEVPHEKGLDGHSDADVALHALMDAMLGAMALGDIGQHFPDTDERYRGISSLRLLEEVRRLLQEQGAELVNADITIVAQRPKLMSFIPAMRQRVADAVGLPLSRISVKATTTERLGFEGRMEGISAQAVALVRTAE